MKHSAEVPSSQGRPETGGRDEEESYDPIVPVKVGNFPCVIGRGRGTHWREGGNKPTYRLKET
jgi:hypothetical protein